MSKVTDIIEFRRRKALRAVEEGRLSIAKDDLAWFKGFRNALIEMDADKQERKAAVDATIEVGDAIIDALTGRI